MKTSELTGAALDWAVAKCDGPNSMASCYYDEDVPLCLEEWPESLWEPSTNWAQGGPIIERESIFVLREQSDFKGRRLWAATSGANKAVGLNEDSIKLYRDDFYFGPTPLIAAMRCYVASKLGDIVKIPDELVQGEAK
jgi:hypothetical protein